MFMMVIIITVTIIVIVALIDVSHYCVQWLSSDSNYKTIGSIHDLHMLGQRSWKYSLDLRQIFYLIIFDDFESEETQYTFTFHPSDLANKKIFLFFFLKRKRSLYEFS